MRALHFGSWKSAPIAQSPGTAYPARVSFRRLLSLLLFFALILAPAGMMGGSPAMAMDGPAMAAMSHHDAVMADKDCHDAQSQTGGQAPDTKQVPGSCCVMMCVAIPAMGGELPAHSLAQRIRQPLPLASDPHGLAPEAEPPPPRFS